MKPTRGFTLIEVMVALTVSSVVVLLAQRLFSGMIDGVRQAAEARAALDREVNARRWLKSAFLSLEVGTPTSGGFEGRPSAVTFGTWQMTPGGWLEGRRIALRRDGPELRAGDLVLAGGVRAVDLDYLLDPGLDSRWVREWISPVSAPLAVRVRIEWEEGGGSGEWGVGTKGQVTDTLLFLVKGRG
ncbi:MAG: PulJ/GspJ family protein [Gemmatimonadales bacterium]